MGQFGRKNREREMEEGGRLARFLRARSFFDYFHDLLGRLIHYEGKGQLDFSSLCVRIVVIEALHVTIQGLALSIDVLVPLRERL